MKKKILALLLVLVMVAGLFPVSAMAAGISYPDAEWYNFRNSDVNMGITSAVTPKSANYTRIKWTSTFGEYIGVPIIVGNYMYIAAGSAADNSYLYKLSLADGSVVEKSALALAFSSNNCNVAPIYVQENGLIIVPMTDGVIQAFNIADMSSAWVYQDKPEATVAGAKTNPKGLGGQCQTPIAYSDGKLYGGFYVSTSKNGNFVCIDASTGALQWYYPSMGGFYWAGPVAVGDCIVVGSEKGNGNLLMFSKTNTPADAADPIAEPKSSLALNNAEGTSLGNQRSSMAYDTATGRVYFTTASGYICSAAVDSANGALSDLKSYIDPDFTKTTASTGTPVIYGDYVYYSAGNWSNGYYFIVANKTTLESVAKVKILGNSQCSWLLSNAYAAEEDYLYFYGTYNAKPGGVTLIKVPTTNPTSETLVLEELYDAKGFEQYCINSPICTADGTIYYRNDSKTIFALAKAEAEVPVISTDLDSAQVKYAKDGSAEALSVTASITGEGSLSYQWQSSSDGTAWANIADATTDRYTPSTAEVGTTYYRCVVSNTVEGKTASAVSSAAEIFVKVLSTNVGINILANTANKLNGGVAGSTTIIGGNKIACVENFSGTFKYIALGATDDGSFEPIKENLTLYQGLANGKNPPSAGNISNSELYTRRYTTSNFKLPYVASVDITAEDGVTKETVYIVVDDGVLGCYTVGVAGFTADAPDYYNADTGISFSAADQTVTLTPVTTTIGSGDEDKSNWAWTSSDKSVAVVDENGTVKCIGGGEATITFTCDQIKKECKVTSSAAKHIHSYSEGKCSVCGTAEPAAVNAYFTLAKDGKIVLSKDGNTELYKTAISVNDADCDGAITLNDAFIKAHADHSTNGVADFVTEESSYGPFITKLWGVESSSVGYYLNNASASGLGVELKKNDVITAYFYQDTTAYSDLYTYISGQAKAAVTNATTYTVSGVAGGNAVVPKGATVKVYDGNKAEIAAMATTVGEDGSFTLSFAEAGSYTIEVGGTAAYTGSIWDSSLNEGAGGYKDHEFTASPVVPSRFAVEVVPYVEKTVYVSISMKNGEFAVSKNGDVMHYFPVTATDDPTNPDGNVTIAEVLEAAHAQYHADGASAIAGHKSNFVTKLWGESNGGNASYYFNDLYMGGSGSKTGSNGRTYQDKLLATVTENNDHIYIYSFQATDWTKGDLYTYFYPVTDTAVAGTEKTFTVKSATGYGNNANKLETSLVKVFNASGVEETSLATTVGADGEFSLTFPSAGTYTVDVRSNGTNYVTPARCTVTVSAAADAGGSGGGSGSDDEEEKLIFGLAEDEIAGWVRMSFVDKGVRKSEEMAEISAEFSKPLGTIISTTRVPFAAGDTIAAVTVRLLEEKGFTYSNTGAVDNAFYLVAIGNFTIKGTYYNSFGEFDAGVGSGWMITQNDCFIDQGTSEVYVANGDVIRWQYTCQLGADIGDTDWSGEGGSGGGSDNKDDKEKDDKEKDDKDENEKAELSFTDVKEGDYFYDAVKWAVEKGITDGTSETTFSPSASCTRAQIVTFLWRAAGKPAPKAKDCDFEDVDKASYYYEAMLWAAEQGITDGTSETTFSPDAVCTRGQMAALLYRFAKSPVVKGGNGFKDVAENDYFHSAVIWAAEQGITDGTSEATFSPDAVCTRGQMVTFLYRYLEK